MSPSTSASSSASPVRPSAITARRRYLWPGLAVAVAIWPVIGVFTWSRAFILRDLTLYFWPKYRWLRDTVWSGASPWWDPYMGAGHSTAADALNQLFLLPTVALRLLLPEPLGFNLWIALPFPLAAWGAYLYFRAYASPAGAALSAVTFAVAGPVVSTGNFPNLSWSVLAIPWVLWAIDRCAAHLTTRRVAALALIVGAQCCAGEPVTLAATMLLAIGYAGLACPVAGPWRARARLVAGTAGALAAGMTLAAVQLVPLWLATRASIRALGVPNRALWSTHPVTMLEAIAPNLYGNYMATFVAYQPWMSALNSGREPFYHSLYVGLGVVLLAVVGMLMPEDRRRWAFFWLTVAAAGLIGAFGAYTPVYPFIQAHVPFVSGFRYPAKYLVFVCMALAALVVLGWSALERLRANEPRAEPREEPLEEKRVTRVRRVATTLGAIVVIAAYAMGAAVLFWQDTAALWLFHFATYLGMRYPVNAVELLFPELPAHAARLLLIAIGTTLLLWVALSKRHEARLAQWVLFALICVDLAVTNGAVNPSADVSLLRVPAWADVLQRHPQERFYFGGRLWGGMQDADPESPTNVTLPPVHDLSEIRVTTSSRMLITPSMARTREMMSFDLTSLWTREYTRVHELFAMADREARLQLLRRGAVRYCLMREPLPAIDGQPPAVLARVQNLEGVALFECDPHASRAVVVSDVQIVPKPDEQAQRLFRPDGGDNLLMLKAPASAAAGTPGAPETPSVAFVRDESTDVVLQAGVGADGGYLLLRDSYDPWWRVEVDGRPAEMLRANLLFRAVRLTPGRHTVQFTYVPTHLYYSAAVSGFAGLSLIALMLWPARARSARVPAAAHTILLPTDEPVRPT